MAFTSRLGLGTFHDLDAWRRSIRSLVHESSGAVVQIARERRQRSPDLSSPMHEPVARSASPSRPTRTSVRVCAAGEEPGEWRGSAVRRHVSVTHAMQRSPREPTRPNADASRWIARAFNAPGLKPKLSFDINEDVAAPFISTGARPRVAVLREQGVNGQIEMANIFERAGFRPFDVTMSDLIEGRVRPCRTSPPGSPRLAFSYGDVLALAVAGPPRSLKPRRCVRCPSPRSRREDSFALGCAATLPDDEPAEDIIPRCRTLAAKFRR